MAVCFCTVAGHHQQGVGGVQGLSLPPVKHSQSSSAQIQQGDHLLLACLEVVL